MAIVICKGTVYKQTISASLTAVAQVISLDESGAEAQTFDSTTLDGGVHKKKRGRDRRRDTRLATEGIVTVRVSNNEVLKHPDKKEPSIKAGFYSHERFLSSHYSFKTSSLTFNVFLYLL